jgi:hypothetical protein
MLLLGGAMIKFDDLHKSISRKIYVPVIGDAMVTRWSYEALMVEQFKGNKFAKPFFEYDMEISRTGWYNSFLIPTLKVKVNECRTAGRNPDYEELVRINFRKINYHIRELSSETGILPGSWISDLNYSGFTDFACDQAKVYLDSLATAVRIKSRVFSDRKDSLVRSITGRMGESEFQELKEANYNESLANFVLNRLSTFKIFDSEKKLIQKSDPVYMKPGSKYGRAHFYAPYKQIGKIRIDTLLFNVIAIWIMTTALFVTLYLNVLKRLIEYLETLKIPIWRKFGRELLQI